MFNDMDDVHQKCNSCDKGGVNLFFYCENCQPKKWISVKDRLPEKSGRYLINGQYKISVKSYHKGIFYKSRNVFTFMDDNEHDEWLKDAKKFSGVTHWMPLPESPK